MDADGRDLLALPLLPELPSIAETAWERNVLYMNPEHRDVGSRDYYMWRSPHTFVSQGSSSSERDEVRQALRALGTMSTAARDQAESASVIAPLVYALLLRSRVETDSALLQAEAFPTAFPNNDATERILELAAALAADELPTEGLTLERLDYLD